MDSTAKLPRKSLPAGHPTPNITQISTETLREMVRLRCLAGIPGHKLEMAGIPHLNDLAIELMRRDRHEAEHPTIPVIAARGREAWLLTFRCRWCRRKHVHGGGPIDEPPEAGHRLSHCLSPDAPNGYHLEIAMVAS